MGDLHLCLVTNDFWKIKCKLIECPLKSPLKFGQIQTFLLMIKSRLCSRVHVSESKVQQKFGSVIEMSKHSELFNRKFSWKFIVVKLARKVYYRSVFVEAHLSLCFLRSKGEIFLENVFLLRTFFLSIWMFQIETFKKKVVKSFSIFLRSLDKDHDSLATYCDCWSLRKSKLSDAIKKMQ